jgi:2-oxoacid:acceptor oxidoreductase gamma subunit (pyruvate/2-ketoisovalerate family)
MAAFAEGKQVQAFPFFGVERRGAPVTAFTRISDEDIRIHCFIYEPDVLVVLDPTLIDAVPLTDGLKPHGLIIINSERKPSAFSFPNTDHPRVYTVDCSAIALHHKLGSKEAPIVNTPILGAVAKATGLVSIDSIAKAILEKIPVRKEENAQAARDTYDQVQG